uniref:Uncharacterized protein n=1 Tax=Podoviridae sp. ctz6O13 TaxID=2827757 RepID=A0A8S5TKL8_9CAUD|nr:MAG TPA: hypothetical protein [Podoviridae sp. ctz6O13]
MFYTSEKTFLIAGKLNPLGKSISSQDLLTRRVWGKVQRLVQVDVR